MTERYKRLTAVTGSIAVGSLLMAGTALAYHPAPPATSQAGGRFKAAAQHRPILTTPTVFGTVQAVTGTTITISGGVPGPQNSTSTYTIDAAHASIRKDRSTSTIDSIVMGDRLLVQGTINGTTVNAKTIIDGVPPHQPQGGPDVAFQRNGKPVLGGTVTNISGNTVTITNRSNITYVVDTQHATFLKDRASSSLADVKVGDAILVRGTVNGADVSATTVIDQGQHLAANGKTGQSNPNHANQGRHLGFAGIFGQIGGFFHSIFHFL